MSVSDNTHFSSTDHIYDFNSFDGEFSSCGDIVTHIIIFKRNDDLLPNPDYIEFDDSDIKLDIQWSNNFGLVDFGGKYLNMRKIRISFSLGKNYKLFVRFIYCNTDYIVNKLSKQGLFIDPIIDNNVNLRFINGLVAKKNKDDSVAFNAVRFDDLTSFRLEFLGHTRISMTKTAMKAYKKYINKDYFLLSPKIFDPDNINPLFMLKNPEGMRGGIKFECVMVI